MRFFACLALGAGTLGYALLATGNHTAGHTAFTTNCELGGCHAGGSNPAFHNGAGASNIIDYAISQGMTGVPPGGTPQIATHIQTLMPTFNPANQSVTFNFDGILMSVICVGAVV